MTMKGITRRGFLATAGLAATAAACRPLGDREAPPMAANEALDALLARNRTLDAAHGPGVNNHVPMVLIALHRMGADPARMSRYFAPFENDSRSRPLDPSKAGDITDENWRAHLGRFEFFPRFVAYLERRARQTSIDAVLDEFCPVLVKGAIGHAFHPLLRLGYAIDYGSAEEIVSSLAYGAATWSPSPDFDLERDPVEPDALFSDLVKGASGLRIDSGNIQARAQRVFASSSFADGLRLVRFDGARPLERMSALIQELFTQTQHFTLLHAVTACQAMRLVLPHLREPRRSVSEFWHSACAAYLTVARSSFETGKDSAPADRAEWRGILSEAVGGARASVSEEEHVIKLAYTCWVESKAYGRDGYRALAAREVRKPSQFK
jgi:hypothetical protein